MKNFTLMILCAGFGSRMLNLTRRTPKPLLKYKNKILLKNTIDFFTNIGCDEIFINTHYLHNKIKKYLDKNYKKYPIQIIYEKKILGTGGGVKNIFNHTKRKNICVVNSDIFWTKKNNSDLLIKGKKIAFGIDSFEDFKMWYEENFIELADLFYKKKLFDYIYLVCGPEKSYIAQKIINNSNQDYFIDCSKKDLQGIIRVVGFKLKKKL